MRSNRNISKGCRNQLERDTAAYFDEMPEEELAEENRLASALAASARTLNVDHEP